MSRVFVISDTHFGHKKVIEFEQKHRPFSTIEEHDETLVDNWNKVVNKRDSVWHLGDVVFGLKNFSILGRLNGKKRLVLGNHDHYPAERYLKYFSRVMGVSKYKDVLLSHVPMHPEQLGRFRKNIHGHTHSHRVKIVGSDEIDERYISVSVEQTGLKPIPLDELLD